MTASLETSGSDARPRRLKRAALALVIWTLVGVTVAAMSYASTLGTGRPFPVPWWPHLGWMVVQFYVWLLLTPLMIWLVRRFPVGRQHWLRSVLVYLPAALLFPLLWTTIFTSIYWAADAPFIGGRPESFGDFFINSLFGRLLLNMLIFTVTVTVLLAADYYRKYQEREFRLAQAQLMALRTQLHPHFLFNTLNAISELVYRDPEAAEQTISNLSDLLRMTLNHEGAHEVSLHDELEFLRKYVEIHQMLLGNRLRVVWHVPPDTLGAAVPSMLLQPLVENAIRHGIAPRSGAGLLEVAAERLGDRLRLTVRDNGGGLPEGGDPENAEGIGLANTRARLKRLYGDRQRLELIAAPERGVTARVTLPFRELRSGVVEYEGSYADR